MKPSVEMKDGKLVATAQTQVDSDGDGKAALSAKVEIEIDPIEAVNEIVKNEVPQWLKDLIASKEAKV